MCDRVRSFITGVIYGLHQPSESGPTATSQTRPPSTILLQATNKLLSLFAASPSSDRPSPQKLWELRYQALLTPSTHSPSLAPTLDHSPTPKPAATQTSLSSPPHSTEFSDLQAPPAPDNNFARVTDKIIILPQVETSFVLEDSVLHSVRGAWKRIAAGLGLGNGASFLQFPDRPGESDREEEREGEEEEDAEEEDEVGQDDDIIDGDGGGGVADTKGEDQTK